MADTGEGPDLDGDGYGSAVDCDDDNPDVHPGAQELCDGINNDCDAAVDEPDAADASTWHQDSDRDGYGNALVTTTSCERPPGFVADGTDCDDESDQAHPGAEEICNDGVDNDCDADEQDCLLQGSIDLSVADMVLVGETAGDRAGEVMAAGDFSGDGTADLLMGMTGYGDGGVVLMLKGPLSAVSSLATPDALLSTDERSSATGQAIHRAGDLNADGYMDVLISATGADGAHPDSGVVFGIAGPLSGALDLRDTALVTLSGESSYDQLGIGVWGDEDMDGDGITDVLVSAERYGNSEDPYLGAVYLLSGPITGEWEVDSNTARITGIDRYDRIGTSLAAADLNGDGIAEVIAGSWSYPSNDAMGVVGVFDGPLDGEWTIDQADALLTGGIEDGQVGHSLDVGDVNGDGHNDVLVGAPFDDGMVAAAGAAYVLLGPPVSGALTDVADAVLLGGAEDDEAGFDVACDGDVNADGVADVLVGAPGESSVGTDGGQVYLHHGPLTGVLDLRKSDVVLTGASSRQRAGETVSLRMDVNGDGIQDVAISAPEDNTGGSDAGIVYLQYGIGL